MKTLIFGFGTHGGGFAAAKYFLEHGHQVRITDRNSLSKLGDSIKYFQERGVELVLEQHRESDFTWADVVVKSPAISHDSVYIRKAKRIVTDFTCLFEFPDIGKIKIVAITGTKGKTTTAAAVAHVLRNLGHESVLCGNMGISGFSVLSDLEKRKSEGRPYPEYIVCELSSWQIADVFSYASSIPVLEASCLTSLYEDHQNYYHSMESYIRDKLMLFGKESRHIIATDSMRPSVAKASGMPLSRIASIEKAGRNIKDSALSPAFATCQAMGFSGEQILKALKTFPGVPHRNEMVRFHNNIIFINDSAATVPQAVEFTYSNYYSKTPVFLICGGTDKELHATGMENAVSHAKHLYLLNGSFTREKLIPMLDERKIGYNGPYSTMNDALSRAYMDAMHFNRDKKGTASVILLSPGAASFELFEHEFDRGDQFKSLVNNLDALDALEAHKA
ncbi:MAG: Mur ligase family protein [Sphaerochaetaceae bacterium]